MEPFRWLAEVTTIEAFESDALDMKDFYFTGDDYSYKIEVEAKRRFLQLLRNPFNTGVMHKGKMWKWDTIILNKTQELANHILSDAPLDFSEPSPHLTRADTKEICEEILSLSTKEAWTLGISRSNLHYLRKHARNGRSFKGYRRVADRLVA